MKLKPNYKLHFSCFAIQVMFFVMMYFTVEKNKNPMLMVIVWAMAFAFYSIQIDKLSAKSEIQRVLPLLKNNLHVCVNMLSEIEEEIGSIPVEQINTKEFYDCAYKKDLVSGIENHIGFISGVLKDCEVKIDGNIE